MALTLDNGWWVAPSGNYPGTSKPITSVGRCMAIGYGHTNPRTYHTSDPHWFTWQTGNSWNRAGLCILFINTTDQDIKLTSAKIKCCSCNSGGKGIVTYTSAAGYHNSGIAANGDPATISSFVRVCNSKPINPDNMNYGGGESNFGLNVIDALNSSSNVWQQSSSSTINIPRVSYNMNQPGSAGSGPASAFGESSSYPEYARFIPRQFTYEDCPVIEANYGLCTLHFDVILDWETHTSYNQPVVRVYMDSNEMELIFEEERGPYIWRMTSGKWVLKRPLQVYTGLQTGWSDVENRGGDNS